MSQFFKETAHNKIDPEKYAEGWDRIFNNKEKESSGCDHKWEYLAQSIFKQCTECEHIRVKTEKQS